MHPDHPQPSPLLSTNPWRCPGTLPRRSFLRLGFSALGGLGLSDLLRLQSLAAASWARGTLPANHNDKGLIVIWLWGGPSHMETFDLKPEAPSEYRGEFRPIPTTVPGLEISEHLPRLARLGDRLAIVRSLGYDSPGHVSSTHSLLTGYPGEVAEMPPFPAAIPISGRLSRRAGERAFGVPVHVALPSLRYNGSAYLSGGLDPFVVSADPNAKNFRVPNLALERLSQVRFSSRIDLLKAIRSIASGSIDRARASGESDARLQITRQPSLLTGRGDLRKSVRDRSRRPKMCERYGRAHGGPAVACSHGGWSRQACRMVTVDFPACPRTKSLQLGRPCQRVEHLQRR